MSKRPVRSGVGVPGTSIAGIGAHRFYILLVPFGNPQKRDHYTFVAFVHNFSETGKHYIELPNNSFRLGLKMKTNTFSNNYSRTGSSGNRVPRNRPQNLTSASTPSNEGSMELFKRYANNVAVIDCEKRKLREHEYHSRVEVTELDIPTAVFFPALDFDDEEGLFGSSTTCSTESTSTSLERRPHKRLALSLDIKEDCIDSKETDIQPQRERDGDSDNEVSDVHNSVPRLNLRMRTMISKNSKQTTHPHHIIPEDTVENDNKK